MQYRETTSWSRGPATFDRGLTESLLRSVSGDAWHEALPLEHAREDEPLLALLDWALNQAGVAAQRSDVPVTTRLLFAPRAVLGIFINDTAAEAVRMVAVAGRQHEVRIAGGGIRFVLFDRKTGEVKIRD